MMDHEGIDIRLNCRHSDMLEIKDGAMMLKDGREPHTVYYTGPLDELFGYEYGALPYRGLEFRFETFREAFHQPACTVNYPNEHDYTRITEFKHCTGQVSDVTTVTYEYPRPCDIRRGDTPYYPIPRKENSEVYDKYRRKADALKNLIPAGRLAEYRYINMNQAVITAMELTE